MINYSNIKSYIKARKSPLARFIYALVIKARFLSLPAPKIIFTPLLSAHIFIRSVINKLMIFLYWQPLFVQYLDKKPRCLYLMKGMPFIMGKPFIHIGEYCRISNGIGIMAKSGQCSPPKLILGDNVFIGSSSNFYIGTEIRIGDDCLIAEQCIFRGYSGHPVNPAFRKAGLPEDDSTVGPIVLGNNVWLGSGVKINKGVHIGENSVIAAGSIVTKDIPDNVIAAGVPARVIRSLLHTPSE